MQGRRTDPGRHTDDAQNRGRGLRRLFVPHRVGQSGSPPRDDGLPAHIADGGQVRVPCASDLVAVRVHVGAHSRPPDHVVFSQAPPQATEDLVPTTIQRYSCPGDVDTEVSAATAMNVSWSRSGVDDEENWRRCHDDDDDLNDDVDWEGNGGEEGGKLGNKRYQ